MEQVKLEQESMLNLIVAGHGAILGVVLTSIPAQSLPET
jgi:hypothetical protein